MKSLTKLGIKIICASVLLFIILFLLGNQGAEAHDSVVYALVFGMYIGLPLCVIGVILILVDLSRRQKKSPTPLSAQANQVNLKKSIKFILTAIFALIGLSVLTFGILTFLKGGGPLDGLEGLLFIIIGGLILASFGSMAIKYSGAVETDSAWVNEPKNVRKVKNIIFIIIFLIWLYVFFRYR